jgi:hypothetical protein
VDRNPRIERLSRTIWSKIRTLSDSVVSGIMC